jgi:hypothetical protein
MAMDQNGSGPPLHEFMSSNRDRILRSPSSGTTAVGWGWG